MNDAVNTEFEAYYRFGALHKAGVANYEQIGRLFRRNLPLELADEGLPNYPHGYDLPTRHVSGYIRSVLRAYDNTIATYTRNNGRQLSLFDSSNSEDLETVIAKHRVAYDRGYGHYFSRKEK